MTDLLTVDRVTKLYSRGGLIGGPAFPAVDDVSFSISAEGPEIFTIIGESGSGKTTLSHMILGLTQPTHGSISFCGTDVAAARGRKARLAFMSAVQPIFQNPFESFNPLQRIDGYLLKTALRLKGATRAEDAERLADEALRKVGLSFAEIQRRFPHELSGGQLQRVAIARALIPGPALLVADEPVSMVDASLRMAIVNLFKSLRDNLGVSIVYITHDLATAYYISDRIIIMQKGKVVESGDARTVLDNPRHPYSVLLKASVLSPDVTADGPGIPMSDPTRSQTNPIQTDHMETQRDA